MVASSPKWTSADKPPNPTNRPFLEQLGPLLPEAQKHQKLDGVYMRKSESSAHLICFIIMTNTIVRRVDRPGFLSGHRKRSNILKNSKIASFLKHLLNAPHSFPTNDYQLLLNPARIWT